MSYAEGSCSTYVAGGDRTVPTPRAYSEPRPRKVTITWPEPTTPDPIPRMAAERESQEAARERRNRNRESRAKAFEDFATNPLRPGGTGPVSFSKRHPDVSRQIAEEYANGMTMVQLEQKHGIHRYAIRKCIVDNNVEIRPVGVNQTAHNYIPKADA